MGGVTMSDENRVRSAWEYHKHADTLLLARVNYSLVAQSMLIVSFSTLFAAEHQTSAVQRAEIGVAVLGFVFAAIQWLLSMSLHAKMKTMRDKYLNTDSVFSDYIEAPSIRPSGIQRFVIPIVLGAIWVWLCALAVYH
jgi:hypothetical protein